jgi:nucleoside-diphosphate-sugar epimerase
MGHRAGGCRLSGRLDPRGVWLLCWAGMRVLILGCGYVGLSLGRRLRAAGHEVVGARRSDSGLAEVREAGLEAARLDLTHPEELDALGGAFDAVINTVSSSRGGAAVYRQVYLEGMRHLVAWSRSRSLKKLIYTSSTSVYGQTDGGWVDEASPAETVGETGRLLIDTERELLRAHGEAGVPGVVLRVAGIYGPGRGHLFQQFVRGEARLESGNRWINMVHLEDVAGAIATVLDRGRAGEIYNVADDEPVTQRDFLRHFADSLDRPLPPVAEPSAAPGARKRGTTNKRVSNRKLRDQLGWAPIFPSHREGYAAAIRAVREAGGGRVEGAGGR